MCALGSFVMYASYFFVVIISLPIHEFAHAYVANLLGDDTAKNVGRLSLNPARHVDIIGIICLFLCGFGWAKPVPVNFRKFSKPKRDMALVSVAGPFVNLLLAFIAMFLSKILYLVNNVNYCGNCNYFLVSLNAIFDFFAQVNVKLAVFNLIPIPPLDGSRVLMSFLSDRQYYFVLFLEKFGGILILLLIMNDSFSSVISFFTDKIMNFFDFLTLGLHLI